MSRHYHDKRKFRKSDTDPTDPRTPFVAFGADMAATSRLVGSEKEESKEEAEISWKPEVIEVDHPRYRKN